VTEMAGFVAWCEACDYRTEHPTRAGAVADALTHRGPNMGHVVKVRNPDGTEAPGGASR
jgi:hypothetical protein